MKKRLVLFVVFIAVAGFVWLGMMNITTSQQETTTPLETGQFLKEE